MSAYESGTVAVATVRGVPNVRVFRTRILDGWVDADGYGHTPEGRGLDTVEPVTDVRPLVVLDANVASYAATALEASDDNGDRYCASQIKAAIPKPPRIPEPGLWGVVKAYWDSKAPAGIPRAEWMRVKGGRWHSCISSVSASWSELIDPTLVRPGIEEDS